MKYYLAGPMTGYPQFNIPLFEQAARELRAQGFYIVSPAELDSPEIRRAALASNDGELGADGKIGGETWGDILARDVRVISNEIDGGLILLPKWYTSRGAKLEVFVALLGKEEKEFRLYQPDGTASAPLSRDYVKNTLVGNTK